MAHKLPRGRCTHCGRTFSLTKAGKLRRHRMKHVIAICGGSGGPPS